MRLPQLQRPLQAAVMSGGYRPALTSFSLPIRPAIQSTPAQPADGNGVVEGRRYASVKSQGAYRIPNKKTLPKKLGAKRSGDQYVIPGNIIFKQRGTIWHPGENALRGRDHTIHAAATGYVKYYRDPERHPHRQYIGVAFNKEDTLPYPRNEPRRRKLGMVAVVRKAREGERETVSASGLPTRVVRKGGLFDIEQLQQRLWSRDKRRELAEANQAAAKANAARKAKKAKQAAKKAAAAATVTAAPGAPVAETVAVEAAAAEGGTEPTPDTNTAVGSATAPGGGTKKKKQTRSRKRKLVMSLAFIQKRWLERRRTKVLHLNPRSYAYSESNAAIGRLASRTMYTPPWKLGGRRSRFRARRHRREERIAKIKADRELVKREREKERIAEEEARQRRLEKQRARGAGKAGKAVKAEKIEGEVKKEAEAKEAEVKEGEKPIEA